MSDSETPTIPPCGRAHDGPCRWEAGIDLDDDPVAMVRQATALADDAEGAALLMGLRMQRRGVSLICITPTAEEEAEAAALLRSIGYLPGAGEG